MGLYLDKTLLTHLWSRRLRLLCKVRYLLTNIRHLSHLDRHPPLSSMRNILRCKSKKNFSITPSRLSGRVTKNIKYAHEVTLQMFRVYSTSRGTLKAEAPIGVLQNSRTSLRLHLMRLRLGESFIRLSRHINLYFKQKEVSVLDNGQRVLMSEDPFTRTQRRALRGRSSGDTTSFKVSPVLQAQKASLNLSQEQPGFARPELFHISTIATAFGESYSYVANHINSVFSLNPTNEIHVEVSSADTFRRSRKRLRKIIGQKNDQSEHNISMPTQTSAAEVPSNNESSSWEEGYLHFARHINRYFGAKIADAVEESPRWQSQASRTETEMLKSSVFLDKPLLERAQDSTSPPGPKSPGLFHMSSLTTRFGENYTHMANHINRYFKGSAEDEMDRESNRGLEKPVSFFKSLLKPSTIPSLVGGYLGMSSSSLRDQTTTESRNQETVLYKTALGRRNAEEATKVLLNSLQDAIEPSSIRSCVEELNAYLIKYPACKAVVWQEKAALQLLRRRRIFWMNEQLQEAIRETLALIGYVDPVKGCGIRVLSIDGGGTKGLVPLQVLKELEAQTGKQVHQLFDYICGVSTGAVLAFMLGLVRISLDDCEAMYHRFGADVFRQNPLIGTVKMGWTHSYYNTETWEMILRETMGEEILIKTARDVLSPKVSAVSSVVNWGKSPKAFIFRNYNHAPGRLSRYAGGSGYRLWQAVRASSAAPGYFQEFPLHGDVHQDGGLILNNPCALAVHESRLLWPNQPFQCVLSLGTGRYDNARRGPATSTSLRAKISNLICSATDTEVVHTLLEDLLSPKVYFRFNPMLSSDVTLDESRPGVLRQMSEDTQLYLNRNQPKLEHLSRVLMTERTAIWKTRDWIGEKAWELQQRWA